MNIFESVMSIFYFINTLLFVYFIEHLFRRKYRYSHFIAIFLFFILTVINRFIIFDIIYLKTILVMLLISFCSIFLYIGSTFYKLLCPFLLMIAFTISEVFATFSAFYILRIPYDNLNNINVIWLLIFENICAFMILKFFLKMLKRRISKKSNIHFLILVMSVTPYTLALSYILVFRFLKFQTISDYICIFILILLTFACDYFLLLHAGKLIKQMKLEIINNFNNQFYLDILQKSIKLKEDNVNYRAIRHDLINYIERIKLENKQKEDM